jgi:hypothetical protein
MSTFSIIALLLSIFNIIDMLVSNANNNNNRNNINDNEFNSNDNSNTESNANPGQASTNQVMAVPPGAGRRRREAREGKEPGGSGLLWTERRNTTFRLVLWPEGLPVAGVASGWHRLPRGRAALQGELALALVMVANAWALLEGEETPACRARNLCELGHNGVAWGGAGAAVVELLGPVLARWAAADEEEEVELEEAGRWGRERGPRGGAGCEARWRDACPVAVWDAKVRAARARAGDGLRPAA